MTHNVNKEMNKTDLTKEFWCGVNTVIRKLSMDSNFYANPIKAKAHDNLVVTVPTLSLGI